MIRAVESNVKQTKKTTGTMT